MKNYEYEQMKDKLWSHSWRLGVHMWWLDFKDLERKKEAMIELSYFTSLEEKLE